MNASTEERTALIMRRAELLAEVCLLDLAPSFMAKSTSVDNFEYDFLIGFQNKNGGNNMLAVAVQAIEHPIQEKYKIKIEKYQSFIYSNIPTLLLVIDVINNVTYQAFFHGEVSGIEKEQDHMLIPLQAIDEHFGAYLIKRLNKKIIDI